MFEEKKNMTMPEKKPREEANERTSPGRFYVPDTDIYETENTLVMAMDLPGVEKENLEINLEKDVLSVEGRVALTDYDGLEPVYTEYNVGHFARTFRLSKQIDQEGITAHVDDGVLTLHLQKAKEPVPRRIAVS
uniref:HSP20 family protein n=1 Tax=Candidatus Kentrum sp. FM TaxID=2126340 RepID=A0A450WYN2_9GAMM|nr:MAG: HSP20 family protein [Candidatus Kentron sp. FM]VFJ77224.1 MAG: HSP20 family protein [Candidatus Kentron sp. FM]VFK22162.1 MAG: HSP20 family protein [Candidatus Kentron sp. FM]